MISNKSCTTCKEFKPLECFYLNKRNGAYASYCKSCLSEKHKESYIKHRVHKERVCMGCHKSKTIKQNFSSKAKFCRECVSKNKHIEYLKEICQKKIYTDDIEFITCTKCGKTKGKDSFDFIKKMKRRATCKECRFPQRRKARKRYIKKHKDEEAFKLKRRVNRSKRRALKRTVADGTVTAKFLRGLEEITKKCPMCDKRLNEYHIDHVIPLSKGGRHTSSNLQLLCPRCNIEKSDKILTLV